MYKRPRAHGFPSRETVRDELVKLISELGGTVLTRGRNSKNSVYELMADRLNLSFEARNSTTIEGENAWRAEVGFARKDLVEAGVLHPVQKAGRGRWKLVVGKED